MTDNFKSPTLRRHLFGRVAASLVTWASLTGLALSEITYDIGMISLGDLYTASGTITTTGRLGNITRADIMTYDIVVDGPTPYAFVPSNPGAVIRTHSVTASPTELTTSNLFVIGAVDNSTAACTNCTQDLKWQELGDAVSYEYIDWDGFVPNIVAELPVSGQPVQIAVVIPEPAAFTLAMLAVVTLLTVRSRIETEEW